MYVHTFTCLKSDSWHKYLLQGNNDLVFTNLFNGFLKVTEIQ